MNHQSNATVTGNSGEVNMHMLRAGQAYLMFYDAKCSFCVRMLAWVKKRSRTPLLAASLQSQLASELLVAGKGFKSCVIVECRDGRWHFYQRGAALQHILANCGGIYNCSARLLRCLPISASNLIYDTIANNRHRIPAFK